MDKGNCRDYRPISLLCVLDKVLTGLLMRRLERFIRPKLRRSQTGYAPHENAEMALMAIVEGARASKRAKRSTAILSFGFKEAFDRAPRPLLLHRLMDTYGVDCFTAGWLGDYF